MSSVQERVAEIRSRIADACARCGRSPDEVRLVGASKRQPIERLRAAWDAGLVIFGENRVQEIVAKAPQMPDEVDWQLIGPLQSNKVKRAVEHVSTVQSIDRLKIARALDREAGRQGRKLTGFLEINVGDEASKHGFRATELEAALPELFDLEHLSVDGVMAIPPYEPDVERARGWFRELRELRDRVFSRPGWSERAGWLSMGMSHDFEIAVEEGATHVRLGTALFGPRDAPA